MTDSLFYPLTFAPIFQDYVWGGRNLADKLGRTIPDGIIAESWEIAAHPDGSSTVADGPLAGKTLPEVQALLGADLTGTRNQAALKTGRFPLLIKLLDANRWLSVQVHPDDEYGLAHEDDLGKTEMWIVLHAEPGAELIYGFKAGVSKAAFAEAIANGTVDAWLHHLPVQAGDVVFVPAGSIHALGPGTIVAEIQQNSNTTYRIDDWGRPRPIHVQQALDVLNFDLVEPEALTPTPLPAQGLRREEIGRCAYFQTERLFMPAGSTFGGRCDGSTFEIWGVLAGSATLSWAGKPLQLNAIEWTLLPAALGKYAVTANQDATLVRVLTP
ncbi:MAG: class I mannose-6-phosphate isomerase [Caldilineaceae bacterium]|nr:class I mannose-6-phosphate isomerase [Caldilineaceae bacterium]